MNIQEYIAKMEKVQDNLLEFLEYRSDSEIRLISDNDFFQDIEICDNKHDVNLFLHLLSKICADFHRKNSFLDKIKQIFQFLKTYIKKYFSNQEIFNIFKSNKRILLFLLEENIIIIDKYIVKTIISDKFLKAKYPQYFLPEIRPFIDSNFFPKYDQSDSQLANNSWVLELSNELPENFNEKRKNGENDNLICELIQKDLIDDFIVYVNKNNYSLETRIKQSIYETNSFLLKNNEPTLIEYAAFFGSIQIFNYLRFNNVEIKSSLWMYAIHGNNAELIHFLEDNQIEPNNSNYFECFKESLKCHHNEIAYYIKDNYLSNELDNSNNTFIYSLKCYNFSFMKNDISNEKLFYYACKNDYFYLAKVLLNEITDINKLIQIYSKKII